MTAQPTQSATQTDGHPTDEELAAVVDGASSVDVVAHVDGCVACAARVAMLRALARELATADAPSIGPAVLARIEHERQPWWRAMSSWTALAAATSCLALFVFAPSTLTPRGASSTSLMSVVADGVAVDEGGVVNGDAALRADFVRSVAGVVVVVAVDAGGDVHWLRPAFVDAQRPPPCPAPASTSTPRSIAPDTVAFDLPPGPLIVRAVAVDAGCDVAALDAAFSAGNAVGKVVDELRLQVRP